MHLSQGLKEYRARAAADPVANYRFNNRLTEINFKIHNSKETILFGGNRSGKTTLGAYRCVQKLLSKPGAKVWCATTDFKNSVRVQQKKIAFFLPEGRCYPKYKPIKGFGLDQAVAVRHGQGEPDSVCEFKSYESGEGKFQSDSVDMVWDDEEPTYDIYQEELLRLLDRNGDILTTLTSLNGYTDFIKETYGKWERGLRPDLMVEFVETEDNLIENGGGLTRVAYERVMEKIPVEDRVTRTKGIPMVRRGLVFKEWADATPFICRRFPIPPEYTKYLIIDPHETSPTAVTMLAYSPQNVCYVYDAFRQDGTVEQIAQEIARREPIKNFRKKLMDHAANVGATKSGGIYGTNIAQRFSLAGITCEMTNLAIKDIQSGIDAIRTRMNFRTKDGVPGLVVFDDLHECRQEIKNHSFAEEGQTVKKKNKHFVDCIKYNFNYGFKYEARAVEAEEYKPYKDHLDPEPNRYVMVEA